MVNYLYGDLEYIFHLPVESIYKKNQLVLSNDKVV